MELNMELTKGLIVNYVVEIVPEDVKVDAPDAEVAVQIVVM